MIAKKCAINCITKKYQKIRKFISQENFVAGEKPGKTMVMQL